MQSSNLLPALQELPGGDSGKNRSFQDNITSIVNIDGTMYAAEFASGTSFGMWGVFVSVNVDDTLARAYAAHYPGLAADHSLYEHWQEMISRGPEAMTGFLNGVKGKVAEFYVAEELEQNGFTNVVVAANPNTPVWDISAISPEGGEVLIQVKTGAAKYAEEIQDLVEYNLDIQFAVSSEIYGAISESAPNLADQLIDIGPDYLRVESITDGLNTLSSNLGIDVPDGVADIVPYAGAVIAGARLIHSVLQTEKEFQAADRTTRNKVQVVQTLTLMSRMGITTTLATAGGMGGGAIGSAVPGAGNVVGGIGGSLVGAGMGMYLNHHLQPHMLNLALNITGLTNDDLFYYKNKPRIDDVALSLREQSQSLAALA